MAYRITELPMTFNEPVGHCCCLKSF